jgi:hypothetical protein
MSSTDVDSTVNVGSLFGTNTLPAYVIFGDAKGFVKSPSFCFMFVMRLNQFPIAQVASYSGVVSALKTILSFSEAV